jgi:hypothetical protein
MKQRYNITLDPDIHDKGVKLAEKKRRKFSTWIEDLIVKESD